MLNKKYQKVLEIVALRLTKKVKWFLIGSANLTLQGMNFQPSDVDILVKSQDKKKILEIFSDFKIVKNENLPNSEGEEVMFDVKGVGVEFCLEKPTGYYSKFFKKKDQVEVIIDGYVAVPCLKLENEVDAHEHLDRKLKSRMIKNYIKNKKTKLMDFHDTKVSQKA